MSSERDTTTRTERQPLRRLDELGLSGWDLFALLITLMVAVVVPLRVVFPSSDSRPLAVLSLSASVILMADIVGRYARARTGFGKGDGQHRTLPGRGWFLIDLLAALPLDFLTDLPGLSGAALTVVRIFALVRVVRVVRLVELQRTWRVRTSFNPALLRLSFFALWMTLVAHWIACGWIAMSGPEMGLPDVPPYQQALYWTITTLTTVGYGDITPRGTGPVAYTMVVMALGAAMYGYIIGNVASLLANIDVMRSRHLSQMETINNFMRDRQVPRHLQAQVRDYYNYLWDTRTEQQAEMLDDLPAPLRTEISLHLNRHVLSKVPLFAEASEAFLRRLALHFEAVIAIPGEAIVRRGEVGHDIYFINRGTVEVLSPDGSEVVAVLDDGDFFGEVALLMSQPRSNTVRAVDYCNLYALNREHFDAVLLDFPDFAEKVRRVAESRQPGAIPDSG